jgi:homoserine trans-succinylase
MIKPTIHTHPDRSVIYMFFLLLKTLKKQRICDFSDLQKLAKEKVKGGIVLFLPALNILFLLGLIEYHPVTVSFEYIGQQ